MLRDYLSAALAESGSLVLVGREAGVGKTGLAEALCPDEAERKALILARQGCVQIRTEPT